MIFVHVSLAWITLLLWGAHPEKELSGLGETNNIPFPFTQNQCRVLKEKKKSCFCKKNYEMGNHFTLTGCLCMANLLLLHKKSKTA